MRYKKLIVLAIVLAQVALGTTPSCSEEDFRKVTGTRILVASRSIYGGLLLHSTRDPYCPMCYPAVPSHVSPAQERATRFLPASIAPRVLERPRQVPKRDLRGFTALASWYGPGFHGKKRADGVIFDQNDPTVVAHKTLPLGTSLWVTNLENGKAIHVFVGDRGPYIPGREFDFSLAAARLLGFEKEGVVKVYVQILNQPTNGTS